MNIISNNKLNNKMKASLLIPEKEFSFEFDNITINQYRMICSKPNNNMSMFMEHYPVGETITLVTSNMPNDLKEQINHIIEQYCNH